MEYRRLGASGLKVSEVALGSWLTFGGYVDRSTALHCLQAALTAGVNFFDTADVYSGGESEKVLGEFLEGLPRRDVVVASKCFFPTGEGPNDRGLSRKHVVESLHASLKRLRLEYLDLYQCHRYDPETPLRELVETMSLLVRQGKILYWGVSMWPAAEIVRVSLLARETGGVPPISNQPCYNMLDRTIEVEVLPVSRREGLGQVVFSPLAQGVLTGKYREGRVPEGSRAGRKGPASQFMQRYLEPERLGTVERLRPIAEQVGLSLTQLALAWCLRLDGVASVIMGAASPDQVRENAGASGVRLHESILEEIEGALSGGGEEG